MANERLVATLTADISGLERGLEQARRQLSSLEQSTRQNSRQISQSTQSIIAGFEKLGKVGAGMKELGSSLTKNLTIPIIGIGTATGKMYMDFEQNMANVATLLDGNAEQIEKRTTELADVVKDISKKTGASLDDLTGGLYQVVSAFGDSAESVKILDVATKASIAGQSTSTDAINLLSAVTKGYADTSEEAVKKVSDLAFMTVKLGQTSFPELASSMGKVIPLSNQLKVSQEEMFTVFATATGVTGNASEVATQYQGVLQALMSPTDSMAGLMENLGFKTGDAMIESLGFIGTLQAITKEAEKTGEPLSKFVGSVTGQTLALALSGSQMDIYTEKLGKMGDATGATDKAFEIASNTAKADLTQALAGLKVSMVELGESMAPVIVSISEFISKVAGWITSFTKMDEKTKKTVIVIAGLVASFGPLLTIAGSVMIAIAGIGTVMTATGLAFLPATALIAGVTAGIVALVGGIALLIVNWDKVKDWTVKTWESIKKTVSESIDKCVEWCGNMWGNIKQFFIDGLESIKSWIVEKWNTISETFQNVWNTVTDIFSTIWETLGNIVQVGIMLVAEIIESAFTIITLPFQAIWQNCKDFLIPIWESISSFLSDKITEIATFLSEKLSTIKEFFSTIWNAIKDIVSSIIESLIQNIVARLTEISSFISNVLSIIRETFSTVFNTIKEITSSIFSSIKEAISTKLQQAKDIVKSVIDNVKQSFQTFENIKTNCLKVFDGIKNGVKTAMENVKNSVRDGIQKVKDFFNITLKFPKIKMPHFSINGKFSLDPPSVPKFSVEWRHKGAIFSQPTVLANGQGVGDAFRGKGANKEAVLPLDKLPELLGLDKKNDNASIVIQNVNISDKLDIETFSNELSFLMRRKQGVY